MDPVKVSFIRLALECHALRFGKFTLKSRRISPYFFNAGYFCHGASLRALGKAYASTLIRQKMPLQHLFGLAYKGLPIATATAIALAEEGINVSLTFNRKEIKDHGEGGELIGAPLEGKIVVIDDVITAGTAFREAQTLVRAHNADLIGLIIAFDRCERGLGELSTLDEIQAEGIKVSSILTFFDLVEYLRLQGESIQVEQMLSYHAKYGKVR